MSYAVFYSGRWIEKTRKNHNCQWCGQQIPAGSRAYYVAGKWEDFWHGHHHPECKEAIDNHPDLSDGYGPGEYSRGRIDSDRLPPQFSPDYRGKQQTQTA